MPFLKIEVTEEFHRQLKIDCARSGCTIKQYVLDLLMQKAPKPEVKLKPRSAGITTMVEEARKKAVEVTADDLPTEPVNICGKPLGVNASAGVCQLPEGHKGKCPRKGE